MAGFEAALESRLSEETQRRLRRVRWENRLTSLWAPVTLFGIAFVVYLFIVELHTPSYVWAQPALKVFGLLMLAALVGLGVARLAVRKFERVRAARHQSWELLGEVGPLADKYQSKLGPKAYDELLNHSVTLAQTLPETDPDKLEKTLKETSAAADKHLATWRKQSVFDLGMGFVKAFAIAMIIRAVLIEPFRIPSGSMIPTLEIGDQIFVNKFIYGVRIPWMNVVPFKIVREPERGDVIVFNNPADESKDFIKRVIGVPGDVIEINEEVLTINGKPQPRELINKDDTYWENDTGPWLSTQVREYREDLSGHKHLTAQRLHGMRVEHEGPFVVPAGHVFVMGDNRDNSLDSRYGLGSREGGVMYVPYGNIKGKAMVIWLAIGHGGLLSNLFGGTGLKTDRFFLPVR